MPRVHQSADFLPQSPAGLHVQTHRGFIEEKEVGVATDGQRKQHALPLSTGEVAKFTVLDLLQAGDGESLGHRQGIRVIGGEQINVLTHPQRFGNFSHLQDASCPHADLGIHRVAAEHAHLACGRPGESQEQFDRGGLPGAVGTEQGHELTRMDGEVYVLQRLDVAIALAYAVEPGDDCAAGVPNSALCVLLPGDGHSRSPLLPGTDLSGN